MGSIRENAAPCNDESSPNLDQDDIIKAEGLDYITYPRSGCKVGKMIVPSIFNDSFREGSSVQTLTEQMSSCNCRDISSAEHADARKHACPTNNRQAAAQCMRSQRRTSQDSGFPTVSLSEGEANRDALRPCDQFKKALIQGMQHKYNHKIPSSGQLSKCSCNSCLVRNIELISYGSVRPMDPKRYLATRTGDICEKIRSVNNVKISKFQKTLTFDISNGKVFDISEGRTDLSCVRKQVGVMRIEDSDSEDDDENCDSCSSEDSEEEEDIGWD